MSAVSANTLFHFTDEIALKEILKSRFFWPRYSLENFEAILPATSSFKRAYIPHVCFCDLTITQLSSGSRHTNDFGRYGIGLKKEWGIKHGVSPVVYVHKQSLPSNNIELLINEITKIKDEFPEEAFPQNIRSKLLELFKYIKPYKGHWQKGKQHKKEIIYYNEREWRYCPSASNKTYNVLSGIKKENEAAVNRMNHAFKNNKKLSFTANDIKYIILDKAKDINSFVSVINKLNLTSTQKNELKTKIITFDEIEADF
jgi:hypothetical protein